MSKFILIPDSFKGTMSSTRICRIMSEQILKHQPDAEIVSIPVADGGEGSVDCFLTALGGEKRAARVTGTAAMAPAATTMVLAAIAAWLAIGVLGLVALRRLRIVSRVLFPMGAAVGVALAIVAFRAIGVEQDATTLPLGLPDLPFHVRVDALSAFFLVLLGAAGAAISWFSSGYFRSSEGTPPGLICFQYHVFMAAMAMVARGSAPGMALPRFAAVWPATPIISPSMVVVSNQLLTPKT
jgi:hypothetical protein